MWSAEILALTMYNPVAHFARIYPERFARRGDLLHNQLTGHVVYCNLRDLHVAVEHCA